jgi:hypothetical protein
MNAPLNWSFNRIKNYPDVRTIRLTFNDPTIPTKSTEESWHMHPEPSRRKHLNTPCP